MYSLDIYNTLGMTEFMYTFSKLCITVMVFPFLVSITTDLVDPACTKLFSKCIAMVRQGGPFAALCLHPL